MLPKKKPSKSNSRVQETEDYVEHHHKDSPSTIYKLQLVLWISHSVSSTNKLQEKRVMEKKPINYET